jgi:natural product biosynthesis luciferase-like monooxygenase protein
MRFSLFFFSADASAVRPDDKYELLMQAASMADDLGFDAVWVPERHFHPFGGLYPNPAILGAALARTTRRLRIRAGSVVLPLQDPLRVAEEWSVVDNLSGGRIDLAFAVGWNPNDFVLAPASFASRRELTLTGIETVRALWRGEPIVRVNGEDEPIQVSIHPRALQPEPGIWLTCSGSPERFADAGAHGYNVLTALLFQSMEELEKKIAAYRAARVASGRSGPGHVTLMLHAYVDRELDEVRARVREPFTEYLRTSIDLWQQDSARLRLLDDRKRRKVLDFAFERYFHTAALFGTPESTRSLVERCRAIGVDELACLIDFGVPTEAALAGVRALDSLRSAYGAEHALRADHGTLCGPDS